MLPKESARDSIAVLLQTHADGRIRCGVEGGDLGQSLITVLRGIGNNPAVERAGPADINRAVQEKQSGALDVGKRIEVDETFPFVWPVPVPGTDAAITTGPPNFSAPLPISMACRR